MLRFGTSSVGIICQQLSKAVPTKHSLYLFYIYGRHSLYLCVVTVYLYQLFLSVSADVITMCSYSMGRFFLAYSIPMSSQLPSIIMCSFNLYVSLLSQCEAIISMRLPTITMGMELKFLDSRFFVFATVVKFCKQVVAQELELALISHSSPRPNWP